MVLELVLARFLSARGKGWLALSACLGALGSVLYLWPKTGGDQALDLTLTPWDGPISLVYHVDGLSRLFALMAALIGAAVLLYSIGYMARERGVTRFYSIMLVFIAGLIHLVYSCDLFLVYLSWEVVGLCSFLLVGFWFHLEDSAAGARKVLIMTHIAGYGLLAAILMIYTRTGTTLWTDLPAQSVFGTGIFFLMMISAAAKSVQFPLHTWIPDAMAAPTPVSALLHAACYVKAGVYLIARTHSFGAWEVSWQTTMIWVGTATLLVGGLYAMIQTDLKRLLAFSTVSQIGYMVMGLGLATPLGIAAALLHCLNHGLFKGGLFLCAGAVQHAVGTRDMDRMGGLGRRMPATLGLWIIGAGAIGGIPLFSGFVSKWLLYNAALEAGWIFPALISWFVSIVTVFYFLKVTSGVFLGESGPESSRAHEASPAMLAGGAVLALGTVVLGIAPQLAVRFVINPILPALGFQPVIGISWLGLSAGRGNWFSTAGLVLAALAVGFGLLVFRLARSRGENRSAAPVDPAAITVFSGGEPLSGTGRLSASDFSAFIAGGLAGFYRWANPDRLYNVLGKGLLGFSNVIGRWSRAYERFAAPVLIAAVIGIAVIVLLLVPPTLDIEEGASPGVPKMVLAGIGAALAALLLSAWTSRRLRGRLPLLAVSGLMAVFGLGIEHAMLRLGLLEGAALIALLIVWKTGRDSHATRAYAAAVVVSAAATIAGTMMLGTAPSATAVALVISGFALKLALVPVYLWLPLVAEKTPAVVVGLIIGVVDAAAFGELIMLRQAAPGVFIHSDIWIALALLSALGGALLMLAQRDLKRLLAFSTIEDMGYLLLGLTLGGELGLKGAVLGIMVHALAKALLFSSLVEIEDSGGSLDLETSGQASRHPLAAGGFLLGALTMLGVPPTLGYAARWRLYGAAAQADPLLMALLMTATALAVLAYARVVTTYWWGGGRKSPQKESPVLIFAVLGLVIMLLGLGIFPGWLT